MYSTPYPYRIDNPAWSEPLAPTNRAVVVTRSLTLPTGTSYATAPAGSTLLTFRDAHGVALVPAGPVDVTTLADTVPGAAVLAETTSTGPGGDLIWRLGKVMGTPAAVTITTTVVQLGPERITTLTRTVVLPATARASLVHASDTPPALTGKRFAKLVSVSASGRPWFAFLADPLAPVDDATDLVPGGPLTALGAFPRGSGALVVESDAPRNTWTLGNL